MFSDAKVDIAACAAVAIEVAAIIDIVFGRAMEIGAAADKEGDLSSDCVEGL